MADTIQTSDLDQTKKKTGVAAPGAGEAAPTTNPVQAATPVQSANPAANQAAGTQQTTTPASQKQGTGFTNIQRVLGASQGNQLGQAVGSGIQKSGEQARAEIGYQAGQTQQAQQKADIATPETYSNVQQTVAQAGAGGAAPTAEQQRQFQQYLSGQFAGPTELQNLQGVQGQVQQAQQLGKAAGTAGGQIGLLQRFAAKPTTAYTSGQAALDQAILGATGGQQLAQARQATTGLGQKLEQAKGQAVAGAKEMQARAAGLKDATQKLLTGGEQEITAALDEAVGKLPAEAAQKVSDLQAAFKSGQITAEQLKQAGLETLAGQSTYGEDISKYISQGLGTASRENVASAEQTARLNALGLLGGQGKLIGTGQEGAFQKQAIQTDLPTLQKQLEARKGQFTTGTEQAQQGIQNVYNQLGNLAGVDSNIQRLVDVYNNVPANIQKMMREGLGDDEQMYQVTQALMAQVPAEQKQQFYSYEMPVLLQMMKDGPKRDAFVAGAGQVAANKAALQQLQSQYGGYKLPTL